MHMVYTTVLFSNLYYKCTKSRCPSVTMFFVRLVTYYILLTCIITITSPYYGDVIVIVDIKDASITVIFLYFVIGSQVTFNNSLTCVCVGQSLMILICLIQQSSIKDVMIFITYIST